MVEQSEEDQDPVLAGYMTFLKKALKTLPDGLRAQVKARAGADVISPTPSMAEEAAAAATDGKGVTGVVTSPTTAPTKALSAVAAAAGQLVGGMLGAGRALRGREEEEEELAGAGSSAGGRGLVRELVERCLFSLPYERGNADASSGGDGGMLCDGETGGDEDNDGVN